MRRIQTILILIALTVSARSQPVAEQSGEPPVPVALETYTGVGSILLVWIPPEAILATDVRVYRTDNIYQPYTMIARVPPETTRFLDTTVVDAQRYFYRVEVVALDGTIYSSPQETPPFSRPLVPEHEVFPDTVRRWYHRIGDLDQLIRVAAVQSVASLALPDSSAIMEPLLANLLADTTAPYVWLEQFPVPLYLTAGVYADRRTQDLFVDEILRVVDQAEPYVRNRLYLTPEEWTTRRQTYERLLENNLDRLAEDYTTCGRLITRTAPLRVTYYRHAGDSLQVWLVVLDPTRLDPANLYFVSGDEYVDLTLTEEVALGSRVTATLPGRWEAFTLMNDQEVLETVPGIAPQQGMQVTLSGEYCRQDSLPEPLLRVTAERREYWLNEIVYSPLTRMLQVEIAGQSERLEYFGLFTGDSLLWEIETLPAFQTVFLDSHWTLPAREQPVQWVHFKIRRGEDQWTTLESYPLPPDSSVTISRIPDGESWQIAMPTLGEPNAKEQAATEHLDIPEVFALYQNFPNPFNRSTTITFDLLQPAIVSLYITDARGRVVDQFLEEVSLHSGTYRYTWFGGHRSSGIYFFTLQAQVENYLPVVYSRKMIYLK
jgi:hypothetical protein